MSTISWRIISLFATLCVLLYMLIEWLSNMQSVRDIVMRWTERYISDQVIRLPSRHVGAVLVAIIGALSLTGMTIMFMRALPRAVATDNQQEAGVSVTPDRDEHFELDPSANITTTDSIGADADADMSSARSPWWRYPFSRWPSIGDPVPTVEIIPYGIPPTSTPWPTATLLPTHTALPTSTLLPTSTAYPTNTMPPWQKSPTPRGPLPTATPQIGPSPRTVTIPTLPSLEPRPTATTSRGAQITATPQASASPFPTYTPNPTYTSQPTYTPYPTLMPPFPAPTYTPQPTYTPYPTQNQPATPQGTSTNKSTPTITLTEPVTPEMAATYTPRPTYTPQPTYTPRPTYTAWPPEKRPEVCPQIIGHVPDGDIASSMNNPHGTSGWGELAHPNLAYDAHRNPYRRWLGLSNPNVSFNRQHNSLKWKAGCP